MHFINAPLKKRNTNYMALLTELFIQIVHSREFVWLTFRVLAIRRGEKLTLDMYRRSTTASLETNPFSQRIFLHSSLLQFCISFDRLCGRSSSCIGSIMSKFSPAVVFFNRTPFSSFCCEFPSYSWRLIREPSMNSFILFESRYFSAFNCHAIKNKIIPHIKCLQRKIRVIVECWWKTLHITTDGWSSRVVSVLSGMKVWIRSYPVRICS